MADLATPVILLVGLLTWNKEQANSRKEYNANTDKARARRLAAQAYRFTAPPKRKSLIGRILIANHSESEIVNLRS